MFKNLSRSRCLIIGASFAVTGYIFLLSFGPQQRKSHYFGPAYIDEDRNETTLFFLETSGRNKLDLRQLAAVESAARFLSNYTVQVLLFSQNAIELTTAMADLTIKYEVNFTRISMKEMSVGSPLQDWYEKERWKSSPYSVAHLSDAFRLLVVWRYGGVYLDLDVLFTRPWTIPNNVLVYEKDNVYFVNGILAFQRHHPFLSACLEEIANNYRPNEWVGNGPYLISRIYKYFEPSLRAGIQTLPRSSFFEIHYSEHYKLFAENYLTEVLNRTSLSIGVHVWNNMNANLKLNAATNNAYMYIVKHSSPTVYKYMLTVEYF